MVRLDPSEVQARITAYRRAHNLSPVTIDPALMALAQLQANAMARANHLSHEIAGNLDHRLNASHHAKGYAVENVSAGYANADAALAGWQRSPPGTTPTCSTATCGAWASPPPTRRTRVSEPIGR